MPSSWLLHCDSTSDWTPFINMLDCFFFSNSNQGKCFVHVFYIRLALPNKWKGIYKVGTFIFPDGVRGNEYVKETEPKHTSFSLLSAHQQQLHTIKETLKRKKCRLPAPTLSCSVCSRYSRVNYVSTAGRECLTPTWFSVAEKVAKLA